MQAGLHARLRVLGASLALLLAPAACSSPTKVELPPLTRLDGLHAGARRAASLSSVKVEALYVVPRALHGPPAFPGLSSEDRDVALLELVAALGDDGALYVTDVLHDELPAAYGFGKLATSDVQLHSAQGSFRGLQRFTPSEDVLAALDTGYQVDVTVRGKTERVVFRPLYDANLYAPYRRDGDSPPAAEDGMSPPGSWSDASFDGEDGEAGRDGGRGRDGKNGKKAGQNGGRGGRGAKGAAGDTGERGHDGGDGGRGGNGASGAKGGDAADGARAEDGPALDVSIRPAFSKFYPNEELVFMTVIARWRDREGRDRREERKSYILHQRQRFTISSVGGRGGDGGAGGAGGGGGSGGSGGHGGDGGAGGRGRDAQGAKGGTGGDGGKGGDGGAGGRGANGGHGGRGGDGGKGGDGGEIHVSFTGSAELIRNVRASIVLASVPGDGGQGGDGGRGGVPGQAGQGGDHGKGGSGGEGGRGTSYGARGSDGADGTNGERGKPGESSGAAGERGKDGERGRARRTDW